MRFKVFLSRLGQEQMLLLAAVVALGFLIRILDVTKVPPSLYWDEAAIAYDAFSLATTGRDMHGNGWLQPVFYSYGDYKAPVYIWLAGISAKLFGPTIMAVRLPSVLAGVLLVLVSWRVALLLIKDKRISLTVSLLIAISPWSLQFSRAAFEANLGVFFLVLTMMLLLEARRKPLWYLLAALTASVAIYSYFSLRIVLPLLAVCVLIYDFRALRRQHYKWMSLSVIVFLLLLYPLLNSPSYQASNLFRLSNNNLLSTDRFVLEQNKARQLSGGTSFSRLLYHRYWFFARAFLENITQHFDFKYLFLSGDTNLRHGTGVSGVLLFTWSPFLLAGVLNVFKKSVKLGMFLAVWWLIALLPAALVFEVPHSLRSLNAVVVGVLFTSSGMMWGWDRLKKWNWLRLVMIIFLVYGFYAFYHDYLYHYPKRSAVAWQDGYVQLTTSLKAIEQRYSRIQVEPFDRYWVYHLFFQQIPPTEAANFIKQLGNGELIQKYYFKGFSDRDLVSDEGGITLYVLSAHKYAGLEKGLVKVEEVIYNIANTPIFYLVTRADAYASID